MKLPASVHTSAVLYVKLYSG